MPTSYAYKVRDREGKMAAGAMEAESEQAVVARLRQMGYAPISPENSPDSDMLWRGRRASDPRGDIRAPRCTDRKGAHVFHPSRGHGPRRVA